MDSTKPWYTSSGVQGGIISAVCSVLAVSGHAVDADTQLFLANSIVQIASAIGAAIGGAVAIYGRVTAKSLIK